jgi:Zn-dependent M16 (insulinase) family peptidase
MAVIHGFELLKEQEVPELNTRARYFRHVKTGAELLSLENDDENKVFGITFRTPPVDSTGIPHIMEHSVLCGSRKYPLKEPFVELVKGSLNTFLNAFTFPDKTCYPIASQNLQDFYNLIDVYVDAVFYPLLAPQTLQQEGWHYELDSLDAEMAYKGVVFNEMKGAYSSPENILGRYTQQSLFPGNAYGVDSGGDPRVIPQLTYHQFQEFHDTYYHPSNARIFFYGDDDPQERLRLMDSYLQDFDPLKVNSTITLQPAFEQPQQVTISYDPGEEAGDKKAMLTVNWLFPEIADAQTRLAMDILSYILVGTPASPLRKALIDSGLGEDLTGGGLEGDLRQMYFSTGLKGARMGDEGKVQALILDTLEKLVQEGIDPQMVAAAVNTTEFSLRENNTGSFPRGLALMLRSLTTWLYDDDPVAPLAFEAPLLAIKQRLEADEPYFENLIRSYFLENRHRTTVILEPESGLNQREEALENERLAKIKASMNAGELQSVVEDTRQLKLRQETPDPPEALATIPSLTLDDLDKENKLIPLVVTDLRGSQLLYHDLFTNGILYLDVGFDLHTLPQEYLPYVTLFGRSLVGLGTQSEDFVRLSQRIGSHTGGIHPTHLTSAVHDSSQGAAWLFLRGKATMQQSADLLEILRDVLLTVKLDNRERFRQMVLEAKASKEAGLVPGGHAIVNTRLRALFDEAGWIGEQIAGIDYLFFLRQLSEELEKDWPAVLEKLETMRSILVNRSSMLLNVTLDQKNWSGFQPRLLEFMDSLPAAPASPQQWRRDHGASFEGLTIPAQVNYVGKGANLYRLGYQLDGSIQVINNYLRTTWLWERVRVQGGAYGGFALFDHRSGVYTYISYRDPNLLTTLDNYDGTGQFLRQVQLSQEELTKSIIGTIGDMDAYQLPDAKGYTSMIRFLCGDNDEMRQRMREQVLSTTQADFQAFGEVLDRLKEDGRVVVLGSKEDIEAANAQRGDWLQVKKVL